MNMNDATEFGWPRMVNQTKLSNLENEKGSGSTTGIGKQEKRRTSGAEQPDQCHAG
ncbi:hypothetical protein FHR96_000377 [Halomonas organivorans]|uniref:Uncharacterized protein n=1 Tax=Halomonas organivorans TaxID=257772 RepID=A0A7W5BV02_9GAMM|nr:hypothetical protein [Halomonas organivorans]